MVISPGIIGKGVILIDFGEKRLWLSHSEQILDTKVPIVNGSPSEIIEMYYKSEKAAETWFFLTEQDSIETKLGKILAQLDHKQLMVDLLRKLINRQIRFN